MFVLEQEMQTEVAFSYSKEIIFIFFPRPSLSEALSLIETGLAGNAAMPFHC